MLELKLLILLAVANGTPVLAARWLKDRWQAPVDAGRCLADGNRLFGPTKTWRGLLPAIAAATAVGTALGIAWPAAFVIGLFAMLGDLLSSFIKRRGGRKPSAKAPLLDQLPESLFPLIAAQPLLGYSWLVVVAVAAGFTILAVGLSPLLYRAGIRRQPH